MDKGWCVRAGKEVYGENFIRGDHFMQALKEKLGLGPGEKHSSRETYPGTKGGKWQARTRNNEQFSLARRLVGSAHWVGVLNKYHLCPFQSFQGCIT